MGRSIAIIGGGIIGASVAYYLSALAKQDIDIHLVESVSIAAAASGKAGGFLAHGRPWHSKNTESLAALSFQLHQELADAHDGVKRWGYRRVSTLQIDIDEDRRTKVVPDAGWVGAVSAFSKLGSEATTGQVHPFFLSEALVEIAQSRGVKIHIATAAGIEFSPDSKQPVALVAKKGDGSEVSISATDIVFAAGPWTGTLAQKLLGKEAGAARTIVPSDTSSSIVLRPDPSHTITNHMLFTDLSFGDRNCEPEVYPRADGTVYLCGAGGDDKLATLPERADQVKPPAEAIQRLKEAAEFVSPGTLANAEVVAEQCCFRPDSQTGLPVIGKVREGIWMASGHGFWGIQNGPGTGKCLAELILGLPTSADISKLTPKPIDDCA